MCPNIIPPPPETGFEFGDQCISPHTLAAGWGERGRPAQINATDVIKEEFKPTQHLGVPGQQRRREREREGGEGSQKAEGNKDVHVLFLINFFCGLVSRSSLSARGSRRI